ncbi:MAG: oxidoreductase [Candidatus Thermoplasmatota archaeon]|jgi:F420-non-reducing hydrogenase small subunit|nr:oxidoreductase [Candidatus Thermoplasmatota archaeon]
MNKKHKKEKDTSDKKLKIAFYWAASCGGCEIAVLDINEKILEVVSNADILFWPVAIDSKYKDVEAMPDNFIDVCFFNGAIRTSENEHMAKLFRKKSKVLISFGACAVHGGIPGLANLANREEVFRAAYLDNPSTVNPDKTLPKTSVKVKEGELILPEFYDTVKSLHQVVDVDYFLPSCPPPTKLIVDALDAIVKNKLPEKGSVLAPLKSVCDECRFEKSEKIIRGIKRVYEVDKVEEKCLLEQGIICLGPCTRGGCDARCLDANMPCTGCGGPTPNSIDQGAKMISSLASILGLEGEEKMSDEEVDRLIEQVRDVVGTFYKYTLPVSLINRRVIK